MSLRPRVVPSPTEPKSDNTETETPTIRSPILKQRTASQTAISQTLASTANLANLLPTGTLLAFQLLVPLFTNNGSCDAATRPLTVALLCALSVSCFVACFTDSVKGTDERVYYGLATRKGMFLFDCPDQEACGLSNLGKYRIRFIDFVHAVLTVTVFGSVALRDKNVNSCLYPSPERGTIEVLAIVPVGVGLMCSMLFTVFPSRRHGIGFPVSAGD